MNLLAYWVWENYVSDLRGGLMRRFSSNQERLHNDIGIGENLWLVTGKRRSREDGTQETGYVLVACLKVARKVLNPPDWKYGRYRVQADEAGAEYFETDGPEMSERLLQLSFDPAKPIQNCERIGQSLQTVRRLSMRDDGLLREWANRCSPIRDGGTRMTFH